MIQNPKWTTEAIETLIETTAAYMRLRLAENAHKPYWMEDSPQDLTECVFRESRGFWAALHAYNSKPSLAGLEELRREAADVSNGMAMLLARLTENHRNPHNLED